MKKTVMIACATVLLALLFTASIQAQSTRIKWHGYQKGLAIAKANEKKIFLHFYAPWCIYCKEMDKTTFANKAVAAYLNAHFVPILVNTDKDINTAKKYHVRGLPANFFLTAESDIIMLPIQGTLKVNQIPGYIPPKMFLKLMHFVGTEGYRHQTFRGFVQKPLVQ